MPIVVPVNPAYIKLSELAAYVPSYVREGIPEGWCPTPTEFLSVMPDFYFRPIMEQSIVGLADIRYVGVCLQPSMEKSTSRKLASWEDAVDAMVEYKMQGKWVDAD